MRLVTCECNCSAELPYADGSVPSYYTDEKKAVYMWSKLSVKAKQGQDRIQSELRINPVSGNVISRQDPLPNLKDYNLYFGVHYNGEHILTVIDD